MSDILTGLVGKRTYILAFAIALLAFYDGPLDEFTNQAFTTDLPNVPTWLWAMLGGGTAATLRAAVK